MPARIAPLVERQAWKDLGTHYQKVRDVHLRALFADDSKRGERMTVEAVGLFLDYSKNRITDETLKLLLRLADESDLRGRIDAMFGGEKINITENRAVLHVALQKYTFGVVQAAQAQGDFQVLLDRDRRALHVHVGADVAGGLNKLQAAVIAALEL